LVVAGALILMTSQKRVPTNKFNGYNAQTIATLDKYYKCVCLNNALYS